MELTYADYVSVPTGFRQRDLMVQMRYDAKYLKNYMAIDDRVRDLAKRRIEVLEAFVGRGGGRRMLDFGCGTGRVVDAGKASGWEAVGCDVIPAPGVSTVEDAIARPWDVVTFFDSLEHVPDPAALLRSLPARTVMISVPNCERWHDRDWFMGYRHRRPGEHLWHWDRPHLDALFASVGYRPVMWSHFEDGWRVNADQFERNILSAIYERG